VVGRSALRQIFDPRQPSRPIVSLRRVFCSVVPDNEHERVGKAANQGAPDAFVDNRELPGAGAHALNYSVNRRAETSAQAGSLVLVPILRIERITSILCEVLKQKKAYSDGGGIGSYNLDRNATIIRFVELSESPRLRSMTITSFGPPLQRHSCTFLAKHSPLKTAIGN
jgi:hypothetical protein